MIPPRCCEVCKRPDVLSLLYAEPPWPMGPPLGWLCIFCRSICLALASWTFLRMVP